MKKEKLGMKMMNLKPVNEYMKNKKKLNAIEMLEKLQFSNNVVISNMAKRIINNESTISQEWDKIQAILQNQF